MKNFKLISMTVILILLVGCSAKKEFVKQDIILDRQIPADAIIECATIRKIQNNNVDELILKLIEVLDEYEICKSRHGELVDFILQ